MDHFKGTNETERFNNDLLNETRRTNELLEQIAQLLKPKVETVITKETKIRGGIKNGNDGRSKRLQSSTRNAK